MSPRGNMPPHDFESGARESSVQSVDYERRDGEPGVPAGGTPGKAAMPAPRTRGPRIRPALLPLVAFALAIPAAAAFALLGPAAGLTVIFIVVAVLIVLAVNGGPGARNEGVREYDPDRGWPT